MNWKANNSKISRVCNNPYTNALTTNAHVSVAVYVSRQPTCLVYVFRVAVRETYKSCGCYVVLYVYGCKGTYFPSHSDIFYHLFKDSYHFQGLPPILWFYFKYVSEPLSAYDVASVWAELLSEAGDIDVNSAFSDNDTLPYSIHKLLTREYMTAIREK